MSADLAKFAVKHVRRSGPSLVERGQERLAKLQARIHEPKVASHGEHDRPGEMDKDEFAVHQVQNLADTPRTLAPEEQSDVQRYRSRWWPVRSPNDDTSPLYGRLASPGKSGILGGLMGGGAGALLGAFLNHINLEKGNAGTDGKSSKETTQSLASAGVGALQSASSMVPGSMPREAKGAILGGLAMGLPSAAMTYLKQRSENQTIMGHMRRLPPGATLRDVPGYGSVYKPQHQVPAMAVPASVALGALLNFPEIGG